MILLNNIRLRALAQTYSTKIHVPLTDGGAFGGYGGGVVRAFQFGGLAGCANHFRIIHAHDADAIAVAAATVTILPHVNSLI